MGWSLSNRPRCRDGDWPSSLADLRFAENLGADVEGDRIVDDVLLPGFQATAVRVVDDVPPEDRHLATEALGAADRRALAIDKGEVPLVEGEDGDVGRASDRQRAELGMVDLLCRSLGRFPDDIAQWNADREELVHAGQHIDHDARDVTGVKVGTDRIGCEAVANGGDGMPVPEAAGTMAEIEDDASFPRFPHVGEDLAVLIGDRKLLGEDVGVDVAGAHLLEEIRVGAFRQGWEEVDHHRHVATVPGLDRAVDRRPWQVRGIEALPRPVVGGLDADDDIAVHGGRIGGEFRVELVGLVLPDATHAGGDDIDIPEDADVARGIDHVVAELAEVAPAGGAGIDDGRDARGERVDEGMQREVRARMRVGDVGVHVDDAGRDEEPGEVDRAVAGLFRQVAVDREDLLFIKANIGNAVLVVGRIDHARIAQDDSSHR